MIELDVIVPIMGLIGSAVEINSLAVIDNDKVTAALYSEHHSFLKVVVGQMVALLSTIRPAITVKGHTFGALDALSDLCQDLACRNQTIMLDDSHIF